MSGRLPKRNTTILLIEDDPEDRRLILKSLRDRYDFVVAEDYSQATRKIERSAFDLVFLDLMLPESEGGLVNEEGYWGLELLKLIREKEPLIPIVVISRIASVKTALKILSEGIVDFIVKEDLQDNMELILRKAELIRKGQVESLILRRESASGHAERRLVYESPAMVKVMSELRQLAKKDLPVLLLGETGTGKELLAREVHECSPRVSNPFVPVNCGAVSAQLWESEMFGHEKGAFTGATGRKVGYIELAHNGTLFLDEITEIPIELQVKLLRVLQEHTFSRVGSPKTLPVNIRVVAATNKDIEAEIEAGRFREDLHYRLYGAGLTVPPLRKRTEDILPLIEHFCQQIQPGAKLKFSAQAISHLRGLSWPGNVRELENLVRRIFALDKGEKSTLELSDLSGLLPPDDGGDLSSTGDIINLRKAEEIAIRRALEQSATQSAAAARLEVSQRTLQRKIKQHGISDQAGRQATLTTGEPLSLHPSQRSLLKYLNNHEYVTVSDAMKLLGDVSRKTATAHLNKLIDLKRVRRVKRGIYELVSK